MVYKFARTRVTIRKLHTRARGMEACAPEEKDSAPLVQQRRPGTTIVVAGKGGGPGRSAPQGRQPLPTFPVVPTEPPRPQPVAPLHCHPTEKLGIRAPPTWVPKVTTGRLATRPSRPQGLPFVFFDQEWDTCFLDACSVVVMDTRTPSGVLRLLGDFVRLPGSPSLVAVVLWDRATSTFYPEHVFTQVPGTAGALLPLVLDADKVRARAQALTHEWTVVGRPPVVGVEYVGSTMVATILPPSLLALMPSTTGGLKLDAKTQRVDSRHGREGAPALAPAPAPGSMATPTRHRSPKDPDPEAGDGDGDGDEPPAAPPPPGGMHMVWACCRATKEAGVHCCAGCGSAVVGCFAGAAHGARESMVFVGSALVSLAGLVVYLLSGLTQVVMFVIMGRLCVIPDLDVRQFASALFGVGAIVMFSVASWLAHNHALPAVCGFSIYAVPVVSAVRNGRAMPFKPHTDEDAREVNSCLWYFVTILAAWAIFSFFAMFTFFHTLSFAHSWIYLGGHVCASVNLWISAVNQ